MTLIDTSNRYQAGKCNIGEQELARRRLAGIAAAAAALGVLVLLVALDAAPATRLLVGIPLGAAAVNFLQVHLRFCAAYGWLGLYNFGPREERRSVADEQARASDRRRALAIVGGGALVGLVGAIVAYLLPT